MIALDPHATAVVAIDTHRGRLDRAVATLPLAADRCGPVIARAAELFREVRALGVPVIHVVMEYRDGAEIAAVRGGRGEPGRRGGVLSLAMCAFTLERSPSGTKWFLSPEAIPHRSDTKLG